MQKMQPNFTEPDVPQQKKKINKKLDDFDIAEQEIDSKLPQKKAP